VDWTAPAKRSNEQKSDEKEKKQIDNISCKFPIYTLCCDAETLMTFDAPPMLSKAPSSLQCKNKHREMPMLILVLMTSEIGSGLR
jgi:hypothetical protein